MGHAQKLLGFARAAALLSLTAVAVLFISAGQLVQHTQGLDVHGSAAIALHISTGVLAVGLVVRSVLARSGGWAGAWAVVLFVLSFAQAALGSYMNLAEHIAGSLVIAVLCAWLAAWCFTRRGAGLRADPPQEESRTRSEQETATS